MMFAIRCKKTKQFMVTTPDSKNNAMTGPIEGARLYKDEVTAKSVAMRAKAAKRSFDCDVVKVLMLPQEPDIFLTFEVIDITENGIPKFRFYSNGGAAPHPEGVGFVKTELENEFEYWPDGRFISFRGTTVAAKPGNISMAILELNKLGWKRA